MHTLLNPTSYLKLKLLQEYREQIRRQLDHATLCDLVAIEDRLKKSVHQRNESKKLQNQSARAVKRYAIETISSIEPKPTSILPKICNKKITVARSEYFRYRLKQKQGLTKSRFYYMCVEVPKLRKLGKLRNL